MGSIGGLITVLPNPPPPPIQGVLKVSVPQREEGVTTYLTLAETWLTAAGYIHAPSLARGILQVLAVLEETSNTSTTTTTTSTTSSGSVVDGTDT